MRIITSPIWYSIAGALYSPISMYSIFKKFGKIYIYLSCHVEKQQS